VPVAIFDNNPSAKGKYILGVQVVGSSEEVIEAYSSNVFDEAIIAIGHLYPFRGRDSLRRASALLNP